MFMNLSRPVRRLLVVSGLVVSLTFGATHDLVAKEALPAVSPDGLQLQPKSKDARVVYLKPGATFSQYQRVAILDTAVEFAKDWQRDYNDNVAGIQGRVSTQDMDRMKAAVAAAFKKVFTEELEKKGGYQVVDTAAPDVLVLRPAIINLVVTAPDLKTADFNSTFVASAGQMTLYLELWDSSTNTILARIMDPQADLGMGGMAEVANSVTNQAAANAILRRWAGKLRKHLDAATGKTPGS